MKSIFLLMFVAVLVGLIVGCRNQECPDGVCPAHGHCCCSEACKLNGKCDPACNCCDGKCECTHCTCTCCVK